MDGEIANGSGRQIELQRLPVVAAVPGNVDTSFGAGIKKAAARGIFANGARNAKVREAGDDAVPGLSGVACAIEIGMSGALGGNGGISDGRIEGGGFDEKDVALFGKSSGRNVLPVGTVVAGEINGASARTGPNFGSIQRRGRNGQDDGWPTGLRFVSFFFFGFIAA